MNGLDRALSVLSRTARATLPAPVDRRLRRAVRAALQEPAPPAPKKRRAGPPKASAARPAPRPEALLRALERGRTLEDALVAEVRELAARGEHHRAQSIATALSQQEPTRHLGALLAGITAARRGYPHLAWDELRRVPRGTWARHAPGEYVRAGLAIDRGTVLRDVRELIAEDPPGIGPRQWYELMTPAFGAGEHELARDAFAVFERHVHADPSAWPGGRRRLEWMRPWIAADPGSPRAPRPHADRPVFAVVDYGHPQVGRGSANIGDHVQTIAALGHLVRHTGVRLHGPDDLVGLLEELRGRVRPELVRTDVRADLDVMTIHRDASPYEPIPEGTWVLCFGWYMHALFGMRYGFPLHEGLRPVFVSFHCNKRELLTPEALDYLQRYGPVGCRDWTTVYLLLSAGVPAFFSGCVTTTTSTVFPELLTPPPADAPVACVDALPADREPGCVEYAHSFREVRTQSFLENVRVALDRLDTYRRAHSRVVTSRLHAYLPLRSMGATVEFSPENLSDPRFDGLIGIDDAAFEDIRSSMLSRLEQVFTAVLRGGTEDEVYGLWRELTADAVAQAERRLHLPAEHKPLSPAVRDAVLEVAQEAAVGAEGAEDPAGVVHCAVAVHPGGERDLAVLARSLHEHASRPVHLWALALSPDVPRDPEPAGQLPGLDVTWVPAHQLGGVLVTPGGQHAPAEVVARLALPLLLPVVDRVVVVRLPAAATGDLAALADLDLGGNVLAAPHRESADLSGFSVVHRAASRLGRRFGPARELRRTTHARHAFDFDAFSDEVLVLDLARARADDLTGRALELVRDFGVRDLEALHALLGPHRADLPPAWAVVPTRTARRGPGLLVWADKVRPADRELTPEREVWRAHDEALRKGPASPAA